MDPATLKKILGRPVAFHRCLVDVAGGVLEGLMLSQALYWSARTEDDEGWFYKRQEEWQEELGMTRWQQETARRELRDRKLWQEKRVGKHGPMYFRVDMERLALALSDEAQQCAFTSLLESHSEGIHQCGKPASINVGKPHALTCTETTTETTVPIMAAAPPEEVPVNARKRLPADWEALWSRLLEVYPKRSGDLGKSKGRDRFRDLLKAGEDPELIIAGALTYAEWTRQEGKWGTGYVKQIPTFLSGRGWQELWEAAPAPPPSPNGHYPERRMEYPDEQSQRQLRELDEWQEQRRHA